MALDPGQRRVVSRIKAIGRRAGATPKEIKAALETGLVESGLRNLPGGDADSAGWRQERASLYKDPTNLDASIRRFFTETAGVRGKYGSAGSLAAAVQRPAAQYRGRYQEHSGEAQALLGGAGGGSAAGAPRRGTSSTRTTTETTPGTDNRLARYNLVQSFLEDQGADPVSFASGIQSLKDIPGTTTTSTVRSRTGGGAGGAAAGAAGGGLAASASKRASAIDRQRLPYSWGGGHGGQTKISDPVPLDCSGAVSKVLGIDPRVADQFKSWGRPGDGGGKGVTVYSKPTHTLMKINGHFFGTSGSNPGGGAGWIPESAMSPQYLAGFTARHSNR